jgi:hypothetical protein
MPMPQVLNATALTGARRCEIHDFKIVGKVDDRPMAVILVKWNGEWLTAKYKEGDREWFFGNYHGKDEAAARKDFASRT